MPYIRDRDIAQINELVETLRRLAEKEGHVAIPHIASRALRIMEKYIVEREEKDKE